MHAPSPACRPAPASAQCVIACLPGLARFPPPQCYNISTTAPLTAAEAETLAWLLRETFEPELLTGGTEFASVAANDAIVEARLLACLLGCLLAAAGCCCWLHVLLGCCWLHHAACGCRCLSLHGLHVLWHKLPGTCRACPLPRRPLAMIAPD